MNANLTEIVFLLDRSGSMEGLESDTVGGFNSFLKNQCQLEGETKITAILFDDKYEILWNGVNASDVNLTKKEYFVRGSTALLDAVGKTIIDVGCRLSKANDDEKPGKVIFVITTDGMENASTEFTYEKVKELIGHQTEKYNWDFIFLGANIDATKEAGNLGIEKENAYRFDATSVGVKSMYMSVCNEISSRRKRESKRK